MSNSLKGVVKWFNNSKGFGFIEHQSGKDVFVHYSVIESQGYKTLKDGEEVQYEIQEGPKGLHAANVKRVTDDAQETGLQQEGISAAELTAAVAEEVNSH
jgi:CspA family cold shock protein